MTYLIIVLAIAARFIPGAANFSPVYAGLLFSGAYLKRRDSIWFPVSLLAASDLLVNSLLYHTSFEWMQTLNWVAFAAIVLVGWWLRKRVSVRNVVAASVAGASIFFLISNFAVWIGGGLYPPTLGGLAACFTAAIPFFGNSLISAVLFSGILFGAYEYYLRRAHSHEMAAR
ncbi:MAG TPA: DUF6580 family putative transport protein [Terriglobia bacterium]|nr:DUF6580 family putative transport protein [Terriglobia bacterium]